MGSGTFAILYQVVKGSFTVKILTDRGLKEVKEQARGIAKGRVFQKENHRRKGGKPGLYLACLENNQEPRVAEAECLWRTAGGKVREAMGEGKRIAY